MIKHRKQSSSAKHLLPPEQQTNKQTNGKRLSTQNVSTPHSHTIGIIFKSVPYNELILTGEEGYYNKYF